MAKSLKIQIIGDAGSFERALRSAGKSADGFGSSVARMGKMAAVAAGGAAVGGLVATLKVGYDEFSEASKVAAQTTAVLKSTGSAANVTAKQVADLANATLMKTGIDDEAIQTGENMLLTFRGVRNEAGKGNDVFNQATAALTDMTTAMTHGHVTSEAMSSAAIRLGKALNDPVSGMAALRRVGVTFTEEQRDQVKAMVAAGDTLGAQKFVLAELNKEFGGSAAALGQTLPGQISILKESFRNMAGELFSSLVPALTSATQYLTTVGVPAFQSIASAVGEKAAPAMRAFGQFFGDTLIPVLSHLWAVVKADILPIIEKLRDIFAATMLRIGAVLRENMPEIRTIFENLGEVIKNIATVVLPLIKFAFETVLPAALKIAIPVIALITDALAAVSVALKDIIVVGENVVGWFARLPGSIAKGLGAIGAAMRDALVAPVNIVIEALNNLEFPTGFSIKTKHVLGVPVPDGVDISFSHLLNIPKLDTGGVVAETGVAVVHRGEEFLGVGQNRRTAGGVVFEAGAIVVNGTADAGFARMLGEQIAVQLRGGRVPSLSAAIRAT